ncbi:MAG TPA: zinc ABC transporter substrate-binding protein, partial [Sphaerochaeta sp.]|nr:zinc ABC transporter substrate-binding protein [Sphaerochaeta sp.]
LAGTTVFVYHNSFGYFLDAFSIKQEAVETGGKEPTAKALAALIEKAKAERPKVIFVQKQFPVASAKTVADAVGAVVVSLDPLAYNWMESIKTMADALMMVR